MTVLLLTEPTAGSVVRNLLALAVASPDTTADSPRDAYTETDRGADDEERDDDLDP